MNNPCNFLKVEWITRTQFNNLSDNIKDKDKVDNNKDNTIIKDINNNKVEIECNTVSVTKVDNKEVVNKDTTINKEETKEINKVEETNGGDEIMINNQLFLVFTNLTFKKLYKIFIFYFFYFC